MKDLVIVACLVIIIFLLVLNRFTSGYTRDQGQKFSGLVDPSSGIPRAKVFDVTIAQLAPSGTESYKIMNEILTSVNPKLATPLPLFTSEAELNQVYVTAFNSGELAFPNDATGNRNRMALRITAGIPIIVASEIPSGILTITYGPDGKPTYTDEVVQKSGKSVNEILTFGMRVLKDLFGSNTRGGGGQLVLPDSTIQMINDILPSEFPKYTSSTDVMNDMGTQSERLKFFAKAYTVGAAYMAWLAENKWKLDLDWSPPPAARTSMSPPPAPVVPVPAPATKI